MEKPSDLIHELAVAVRILLKDSNRGIDLPEPD